MTDFKKIEAQRLKICYISLKKIKSLIPLQSFKKGLSALTKKLVSFRNLLYQAKIFDLISLKAPVISVGNLTMGGTGKTPFVDFLMSYYEAKGQRVAVISRNYKALIRSTKRVDIWCQSDESKNKESQSQVNQNKGGASVARASGTAGTAKANYYGDEPYMLATRHPNSAVYVGPQKWKTALLAEKEFPANVFIVDDGFQHRSLKRDLDIVLLDATCDFDEYEYFPLGRAREDFNSLQRAHWLVLTRADEVEEEKLKRLLMKIPFQVKVIAISLQTKMPSICFSVAKAETTIAVPPRSAETVSYDEARGRNPQGGGLRFMAFAGIANPEAFNKKLKEKIKIHFSSDSLMCEFFSFPDHYAYTHKDLLKLQKIKKDLNVDYILTTEKDWVKICEMGNDVLQDIHPVGLELVFLNECESFYADLDKVIC